MIAESLHHVQHTPQLAEANKPNLPSPTTHTRATSAGITVLPSDAALVSRADYILSIVPPRDAVATANRILDAFATADRTTSTHPLYFLDLNAIAPSTALSIAASIAARTPSIRFVDGGIIGGPPKPLPSPAAPPDDAPAADIDAATASSLLSWYRPSIPVSGPHAVASAPLSGAHLAAVLRLKHLADAIGPASGLKASFAALTKGFYALAIQSYSTAAQLGVLPELQAQLAAAFPATRAAADRGLVHMPPKAYRWVGEMREINRAFADAGGWAPEANVFDGVAEVYRVVADETALGTAEGRREDVEGVVAGVVEGLRKERKN
ncbi:hypothetical protein SLS56_003115 [Neofusicoccum ribis]|uniref:Phosphogluconate dehydrogenase NAD-binding putative C-terminal domain-containing protein n=1 Tax=Neofusicoccum ribis TaxID=45134 RepID=A0ABR3T0E1_9PEZI